MIKQIYSILFVLACSNKAFAQIDASLLKRVDKDTSQHNLTLDATYNRPFLKTTKLPISMGGYIEMNYQHKGTDGVSDGHEFQFRRLSLFVASSISKRIKFLSEIEFEHDKDEELEGKGMEIDIEYAAMDIEFNPLLNLRSGIILNPIGSFNQNHDGPKWEFVDRPIAMTQLLPATFSNAGFGIFGKYYKNKWMVAYEMYATGGFDNSIIDNDQGKTYLPHGKENTSRFATSNSGSPLLTTKVSIRNVHIGELGLSWMGGVYNKFQKEGLIIDDKRRCDVFDIDFNTEISNWKTKIVMEGALVFVQTPTNFNEQFGRKQLGAYIDVVQPVLNKTLLGWEHATLNIACRADYADWNVGVFKSTGKKIGDYVWRITPAISFRPSAQTVLRFNYSIQKQVDFLGNPPSTTGGVSFGFSSYF